MEIPAGRVKRAVGLPMRPNLAEVTGFDHLSNEHGVRPDIAAAFDREWRSLQRPGSHYTSSAKIAIAARVRARHTAESSNGELPAPAIEAVDRIAGSPASIRREWVSRLVTAGLPMPGYVETVSLVSRIAAVDAFHDVMGISRPALPEPGPGAPTGDVDPSAKPSKGFVPMIRGTSIWWSLTLVPEGYSRMEDLHNALYLTPEQMHAPGSPRELSRPQIELIASRTSTVNECFY